MTNAQMAARTRAIKSLIKVGRDFDLAHGFVVPVVAKGGAIERTHRVYKNGIIAAIRAGADGILRRRAA